MNLIKVLSKVNQIEEIDRENWSIGGELHLDKFGKGCSKNVSKQKAIKS